MDLKAVTTGLVALIVAVMVIALVAVPVVEDATVGASYTGQNTGYDMRYTDASGKAVTWSWSNGSATVTIDGQTGSSPLGIGVISDKVILRPSATGLYWYDLTDSTFATVHGTANSATLTVAASGAYTLSVVDGETTTKTGTISKILVSTENGPIGHFSSGVRATLGSTVYVGSFTNTATLGPVRMQEFRDGIEGAAWFSPWVLSGESIVAGPAVSYDMTYSAQGEGQQVGVYSALTTTSGDVTTSQMSVYAPIDYKSTAVEGSGGINQTLLAVIPLLLFIVAVMIAVRLLRDA